ncbi:hypothetical protein F0U60_52255 [Archangium minus]|uniref:Uncharacterized protein n=1 Tax=Archangium minus TaxID=83450 RepID=A0ABY9X8L5_9BACT|nr:hypothetical protein F0U61_51990 [Archangium violaceum]WNG51737.1 hypothetical protein F0U60_52255 [Archangium minus]
MVTNATRLVDRLKGAAVRMGTEGVRYVVEGTIAAVKVMDRIQELLPRQEQLTRVAREKRQEEPDLARPIPAQPEEKPSPVRVQAQATAERVLEEAQAVQERIKKARPARNPLKVTVEAQPDAEAPKRRKTTRSQGRKTTASATAPKRATAPKEGFKAKRGQKHD